MNKPSKSNSYTGITKVIKPKGSTGLSRIHEFLLMVYQGLFKNYITSDRIN